MRHDDRVRSIAQTDTGTAVLALCATTSYADNPAADMYAAVAQTAATDSGALSSQRVLRCRPFRPGGRPDLAEQVARLVGSVPVGKSAGRNSSGEAVKQPGAVPVTMEVWVGGF